MSTKNSGNNNYGGGLIGLWTLVAVVLHFCEIGAFAEWPITAWPWHWSCLCLFWWSLIIAFGCIIIYVIVSVLRNK